MNKSFLRILSFSILLSPFSAIAQVPDLGSAADYAVFTAAGAFGNLGATTVVGNAGTFVGAYSGFSGYPMGQVIGETHVADTTASRIADDVRDAYTSFAAIPTTMVIGVTLGNNQILTPNVYAIGALSTLTGVLTLDAQNDPNAIFIFKIGAAFSAANGSSIVLANGAKWNNVYWRIGGQFDLGENVIFAGSVVVDGDINILEGTSLDGRALSRAGAISLANNDISLAIVPLAVKLVDFSGNVQDGNVLLNWKTANEQNSYNFIVERSRNVELNTWENIGTTSAAGNAVTEQQYKMLDKTAASGTNYYRLRSNDVNGTYSLSKIITVVIDKASPLVMAYPNPVQDVLTVTGITPGSKLILTDMTGKTLSEQHADGNNDQVNTSRLLQGNYFLKIVSADGRSTTMKLNK